MRSHAGDPRLQSLLTNQISDICLLGVLVERKGLECVMTYVENYELKAPPPHPSSSNSLLICFMLQHSFYMQCNWNNAWICPSVWFATWYGKLCSPNWFFAIKLKLLRNVKTNMYMYTNTPTKLRELVVFNQLSPNLGN